MAAPRSLAMLPRLRRVVLGGYAALGVSVCAGAYFDDGFRRSLTFWGQAFPIYLHYEFVHQTTKKKTDEEIAAAFDKLHNFYAPIAKRICLDLRGFYLKTAQLASTITSTVPPQYMEWCTEMQDEVPTPFSKGQARMLVEEALECPLEDVFIDWSDEPCGSASIGQVHRARLKSNGKEVAIKIQYPGIEHKFRSDLKNIIRFCKLAMPQHVKPLREIEKQFLTEFDYKLEAQNLVEIERNLQKQWSDRVCVPKPILPLCKKTILTMEYLHGVPLLKGIEKRMEVLAKQQGRTLEDLEKDFRDRYSTFDEVKDDGEGSNSTFNDSAHGPSSLAEEASTIRWLQRLMLAQDAVMNLPRFLFNYTFGFLFGKYTIKWSDPPLNLAEIIQLLLQVHAHEIFIDGVFNGDPHPGNVLLMEDGRLGLIDYGQVKRIAPETRVTYAKLIIALCEDNKDEIIRIWKKDMNQKSRVNDPDVIYLLACFWHDRNTRDVVGNWNLHQFLEVMEERDPVELVNEEYVMAARVSVLMRGFGNMLGLSLRVAPLWRPYAEEAIKLYGHVEGGVAGSNNIS